MPYVILLSSILSYIADKLAELLTLLAVMFSYAVVNGASVSVTQAT